MATHDLLIIILLFFLKILPVKILGGQKEAMKKSSIDINVFQLFSSFNPPLLIKS